jgi:hypothetical protein
LENWISGSNSEHTDGLELRTSNKTCQRFQKFCFKIRHEVDRGFWISEASRLDFRKENPAYENHGSLCDL